MRMAFGLVSILVVTLIIVWLFADFMKGSMPAMQQGTNQANQFAGRNTNGLAPGAQGTPVMEDARFSAVERNGRLVGARVTALPSTNGLAEFFGLAVNDIIVGIGPFKVGEDHLSDLDSVRDFVQDAYQYKGANKELVVDRGGTRITLPRDRNFIPPPPANTGTTGSTGAANPGTTTVPPEPQDQNK